jgi:hypothetical protein
MSVAPRLKIAPPQNVNDSIINVKIAGKEFIGHSHGNKMLRTVVIINLPWLNQSDDNAVLHDKMYAIYKALAKYGYSFCAVPDKFSFEPALMPAAILAVDLERKYLLKQSAEGEALTLEEDLKRLRSKMPKDFLAKFQCELEGYYGIHLHSSHTTPISLFQMDPEGKRHPSRMLFSTLILTTISTHFHKEMEPTSFHLKI